MNASRQQTSNRAILTAGVRRQHNNNCCWKNIKSMNIKGEKDRKYDMKSETACNKSVVTIC